MTEFQVMDLRGTLNSMDDTLTDEEVLMFLEHLAQGREYDMLISATPPSKALTRRIASRRSIRPIASGRSPSCSSSGSDMM